MSPHPSKFAFMMPKKMTQLVSLIEAGDRISGDELLIALREHEDGPLPEMFIEYLGKALSGWEENKPGPKPKGSLYRSGERIYFNQLYMCFMAELSGEFEETYEIGKFATEHLPDIDSSFSPSEKASQLVAL